MRLTPSSSVESATGTCTERYTGNGCASPSTPKIASFELRLISTITCCCDHLRQQIPRPVLVHHVHAVADALRVGQLHRLADVEAQSLRRHQPRRQFARVQRNVHVGILRMQIADHLHLQGVVAHGDVVVFRPHKVDADPRVILRVDRGFGGLEAQQRLRENLLRRKSRAAPARCSGPRPGKPARPAARLRRSAPIVCAAASAARTSSRSAATSSRNPLSSNCWRNCANACGSASANCRIPADVVRDLQRHG